MDLITHSKINIEYVDGNFEICPHDRLGTILCKYSDYKGDLQICEHVSGSGELKYSDDTPLIIFHSEGNINYIDLQRMEKAGTVLHCNYKWTNGHYFNYWGYQYLHCIDINDIKLNSKNSFLPKFLCLNGRPDWHRYATLQGLVNKKLYDNGLISFLNRFDQYDNNYAFKKFKNNFDGNIDFVTDLVKNNKTLILDMTTEDVTENDRLQDNRLYENSSISLVTETCAESNKGVFITEKSWKPIANCHFQIWIGQPGIVQAFRDFGFDMFDDIIDHSYDTIEDDFERIDSATNALSTFINYLENLNFIQKFILQRRLRKNQKKYLNMKIDNATIKDWIS